MTTEEWLDKVAQNKDSLAALIGNYHPASKERIRNSGMPITAPVVELACETVREMIRARADEMYPTEKFQLALDNKDIDMIYSLLSDTWMGVPESTSCWSIDGFAIAVDLMDDLPEEMYGEDGK